MFSHTYDTCPLVVCDHEYCYFLPRFGLLHNTTHWGKIEGTRSLVLCLFSYSKHANGRIFFQVLLPFSPVRGELPFLTRSGKIITQIARDKARNYSDVCFRIMPVGTAVLHLLDEICFDGNVVQLRLGGDLL